MNRLKAGKSHSPVESIIVVGLSILLLWLIGLMVFMANGQTHVFYLVIVASLVMLLTIFARRFSPYKYLGYIIAIFATIIALVGYSLLQTFLTHTEFLFALGVIGVSARWGAKLGYFNALLAAPAYAAASHISGHSSTMIDSLVLGGFLIVAAFIVGTLTQHRESALASRARLSEELNLTYLATLRALASALEARDHETRGHSERVTSLALAISHVMGFNDDEQTQQIHWGALLHDVGKIGVPDSILHKPGALSEKEWEAMRKHPQIGYAMLSEIMFLKPALDVVLYHHERFDGNGYPKGLKGENIPSSARIFAVTDTYDAMTSDRPYRKACSSADAINEIHRLSGIQFDPKVVIAFEHVMVQNNFLLFKETHPFA